MASVEEGPVLDSISNNNDTEDLAALKKDAPVEAAVAAVTPEKANNAEAHSNSPADSDTGDTVSETSVASESEVAEASNEAAKAPSSPEASSAPPVEAKTPVLDAEDTKVPESGESPSSDKENDDGDSKPSALTVETASEEVPTPPLKTNRVSMMAASVQSQFASPSSSLRRVVSNTTTPGGTGLSELSKQLRVLQAKNQYLKSEMERCQRQLKIMSESKGVSVLEVLKSLETACANEASAELHSQITSLQAQLDALQMQKGGTSGSPSAAGGRAGALQMESFQQQIAALELQVGEAEEMEAKLKQETKSLYTKVQTHQTTALTMEATCQLKSTLLEAERSKNAELEAEIVALKEERDALKEKDTKRMAQKWHETLEQGRSDVDDPRNLLEKVEPFQPTLEGEVVPSTSHLPGTDHQEGLPRDKETWGGVTFDDENADVKSTPKPNLFAPSKLPRDRPGLRRTFSDPAIRGRDLDAKDIITPGYVSSMLPRYCSTHKQWQWSYDVDDTHRSNLFVKQSAKNMELEALCRHQQETIHDLQNDQTKDEAKWKRLELERNAARTKRDAFEQQVSQLELDLRLEKEQAESLKAQLEKREEEHTLKKDQLQSRLQVHQERIHDVEGQLSSLYVAFELLQEDRSEEQMDQALLRSKLVDADSKVAAHMSRPAATASGQEDAQLAQRLAESASVALSNIDTSETGSSMDGSESTARTLRQRAGLLSPSPRGGSVRKLFSRSPSTPGLPPATPMRSSATPPGLPTPTSLQKARRSSTGSASGPPPPGTTICKGYLMQQQCKKKKLLRGETPPTWKRRYMVLKRGEVPGGVGSYSLWYGGKSEISPLFLGWLFDIAMFLPRVPNLHTILLKH